MDDLLFTSWPRIVAGATVLAALFGLAEVLGGVAVTGDLAVGRSTVGLAGVAFWGYLLIGFWIHRNPGGAGG